MKPRIVLSGVNFIEAGPLSIYGDALRELAENFGDRYEIVALVHRRDLFDIPGITYLEFPGIKTSWLRRIRFEYWDCRALSRRLQPHLWLSMHDMTPNVTAAVRAVYCHNPAPFYRLRLREALTDWTFTLFTLLYRFLYAINLRKSHYIVVQQQWLREEFARRYHHPNIVVAHPSIQRLAIPARSDEPGARHICRFFYPTYPRSFKNLEVVLEAARILERSRVSGFEIWLTVDGTENTYSARMFSQYQDLGSIRWLGILPRDRVRELYGDADCLLFPSKLETWGMPISEFQQTGKPMLVADLPYAHETVGTYDSVQFFPPDNPPTLADDMALFIRGELQFRRTIGAPLPPPFALNWNQLFQILLGERPQTP